VSVSEVPDPGQASLIAETLESLRSELEPEGWRISLTPGTPRFSIRLSHDLTHEYGPVYLSATDADSTRRAVRGILSTREVRVIKERPRDIPHAALLGLLREWLWGYKLGESAVVTLARRLRLCGVITDIECEWLEDAGPAWDDTYEDND
jgi:hypothetical protein